MTRGGIPVGMITDFSPTGIILLLIMATGIQHGAGIIIMTGIGTAIIMAASMEMAGMLLTGMDVMYLEAETILA
jgi:hypothetical protein